MIEDAADQGDDVVDMGGDSGFDVGREVAHRGEVGVQGGDRAAGQFGDRGRFRVGAGGDLVFDVGDVAHVGDAPVERAQDADEHVGDDERPHVADVSHVVDGRAAHVEGAHGRD